ncbi:MAG: Nif3-like dinuclear metal center hexameric protein [Planctomycetes bacterium]|nr:Nif3-like dinuclear metal center hexameric protein [Planctomycetota bacterium]
MAKQIARTMAARHAQRSTPNRGNAQRVSDLCHHMEALAPSWSAADWDNVGLLVGSAAWPLRRILLTIDLTTEVLAEAKQGRYDAIVAYHPPIFRAVKNMRPGPSTQEGVAAEALASRIAVYSPHTALDASDAGPNAVLAQMAGIMSPVPIEAAREPQGRCKLVVFVPHEHVERVAAEIFDAGGGRIGEYSQCSFRIQGEGTFFGSDAANPTIGSRKRRESVPEIRLEVVFPRMRLAEVVRAVRGSHPYEEPAFDVYPLETPAADSIGQGRMGALMKPISLGALAGSLGRKLSAAIVAVVGKTSEKVRRGFVCVGAAGSLPFEISGGAIGTGDVVLTGEIRHHDALRYVRCGAAAIALGHWASERPVLGPLSVRLRKALRGSAMVVSRRDRDPFTAVNSRK